MLMEAVMATEHSQNDHHPEQRTGIGVSESGSDSEEIKATSSGAEVNGQPPTRADPQESMGETHCATGFVELAIVSTKDMGHQESTERPDPALESTESGGGPPPTTGMPETDTQSGDIRNERDLTGDQTNNVAQSIEMTGTSQTTTDPKETVDQTHNTTESWGIGDQAGCTIKSEEIQDHPDITDFAVAGSQLERSTDFKDISDSADYTTETTESSSQSCSTSTSNQISDNPYKDSNREISDQPDPTIASKEISDQLHSTAESTDHNSPPGNTTESIEITDLTHNGTLSKEIFEQPQTTPVCVATTDHPLGSDEISGHPEITPEFEESSDQLHTNMESEVGVVHPDRITGATEILEHPDNAGESNLDPSGNTAEPREMLDQPDTTEGSNEILDLTNQTAESKETLDQPGNTANSEKVTDHLGSSTESIETRDQPDNTTKFKEAIGYSDSSTEANETSSQLDNIEDSMNISCQPDTIESEEIIDPQDCTKEPTDVVNLLCRIPDSEDLSGQLHTATGFGNVKDLSHTTDEVENSDRLISIMEAIDCSNASHKATGSAESMDGSNSPVNDTDIITGHPADTVRSTDTDIVPPMEIQSTRSDVETHSSTEIRDNDDVYRGNALSRPAGNGPLETNAIIETCIDSDGNADVGLNGKEPTGQCVTYSAKMEDKDPNAENTKKDSEHSDTYQEIRAAQGSTISHTDSTDPGSLGGSETTDAAHHSTISQKSCDGSYNILMLPEANEELSKVTEEPNGANTSIPDSGSSVQCEANVMDAQSPVGEGRPDSIHITSDGEAQRESHVDMEIERQVAAHLEPNELKVSDSDSVMSDISRSLPAAGIYVQSWEPVSLRQDQDGQIAVGTIPCSQSLKNKPDLSINEGSAIFGSSTNSSSPSESVETLAPYPVPHEHSIEGNQIPPHLAEFQTIDFHHRVVDPETDSGPVVMEAVGLNVEQTQLSDTPSEMPSAVSLPKPLIQTVEVRVPPKNADGTGPVSLHSSEDFIVDPVTPEDTAQQIHEQMDTVSPSPPSRHTSDATKPRGPLPADYCADDASRKDIPPDSPIQHCVCTPDPGLQAALGGGVSSEQEEILHASELSTSDPNQEPPTSEASAWHILLEKDENVELIPDGKQACMHPWDSKTEGAPPGSRHKRPSSVEVQTTVFLPEEWKGAQLPYGQESNGIVTQQGRTDRSLNVDPVEPFPLDSGAASAGSSEDPQESDAVLVRLNAATEPRGDEVGGGLTESHGVSIRVNTFGFNVEFMKFLSQVPQYFRGEADEELPVPGIAQSSPVLVEESPEACLSGGGSDHTSVDGDLPGEHPSESSEDTLVKGVVMPPAQELTPAPINCFNPCMWLDSSPQPANSFFEDMPTDPQNNQVTFGSPATAPSPLHFLTVTPPIINYSTETVSANESHLEPQTKRSDGSVHVPQMSPMSDYPPAMENVFLSPHPTPVTVITGTADTEGRSIWAPTWKVPDDSVLQALTKKLGSPKLGRRTNKVYRTSGGATVPDKEAPHRHSTPVLVSHHRMVEEKTMGGSEHGRNLFKMAPESARSKALFNKVAVSEEATLPVQVADRKPTDESKSGRWCVRVSEEGDSSWRIPHNTSVQTLLTDGCLPPAKSSSCPGQAQDCVKGHPSDPAAVDMRSQEDLTGGEGKSRDWRRKCLKKIAGNVGLSQEGGLPDEEPVFSKSDPVHLRARNDPLLSSNIIRRRSKLINSSRLLYQEYSDVALNHAIERQKRAETFMEESDPSSPRLRRKLMSSPDSYLQRLSVSSSASLWQDIPMIRGTSTLLSMTRDEQKLQEAKFELIMSEASYLRSLNIAVDHFQHSQELQGVLTNQERQWLFSRLQEVRDVSSNFLFDLEEKFEDNMYTFNVCDVVLSHAPEIQKVYVPYVTNQSYQDQTFQRLLSGNPRFQQVLDKLESDPVCQRLSLKSFLILPFQRITRLKLLVQNILKRTRPGSREEAQATQAYTLLEKLIKDCNENVQRMRSTEELIYLNQKIEFECKIFPLISQSRRLVKHGELVELETSSPLSFKWKVITRPIYMHLFNDCLLLSRRREGSRFLVFDHARASKVRGEKCEMKMHGNSKNIFRLILQENNQGRSMEFLLRTETQSEKLRWISALASNKKKQDFLEWQDKPQVQCLKSYKARENDELSLEKADVIMVTQQSKDGWMEGTRLADGEHGWFPVENVEDISSKHVRLRNLKEEQRVQHARAKLMPHPQRR
ncbi:uncharacterized protein [Ambystoma mexicanum]